LHAVDAVAALHRFTDMGLEPFLVASAVSGVIGQRLIRRNCHSCATDYRPPPDRVRLVAAQLGTNKAAFKKGEGCALCNYTGYRGRVGVYELLVVSDAIRQMIVEKATHTEMRKVAIKEGMKSMQLQAFQLVADGVTTVEEVMRSVYAPGVDLDLTPLGELMPAKRELGAGAAALEAGEASEASDDEVEAPGDSDEAATDRSTDELDELDDLAPPDGEMIEDPELQPVEGGA
jgi:type IV pilus assembly protein PilB